MLPTLDDLPPPLVEAHADDKLAVLVGSGLSMASDVSGAFPRWTELPARLLEQVEKQGVWSAAKLKAKRDFFEAGDLSLDDMLAELDTLKRALGGIRKYRAALSRGSYRTAARHGERSARPGGRAYVARRLLEGGRPRDVDRRLRRRRGRHDVLGFRCVAAPLPSLDR